jgi:Ca2+-binding EF-hand superfamily protein
MAGLNDFQKKKYLHVFKTFYDLDGNGVIEWGDFELDLAKLSTLLKWEENSDAKKKAETALRAIWDDLRKFADKNKDGEISKEEWLNMWSQCLKAKDAGNLPSWITHYMEFMFSINDGNGDNVIDCDEYTALFTNYGLTPEECKQCFDKITDGGKIALTVQEYNKLWSEFFLSTDEAARGNSIFGVMK